MNKYQLKQLIKEEVTKLKEGNLPTYQIEGLSKEKYDKMEGIVREIDKDTFMNAANEIIEHLSDEGFDAKEIFDFLYHNLVQL